MKRIATATAAALLMIATSSTDATAADKKPLSSLPTMPNVKDAEAPTDPKKIGDIAGITMKDVKNYGSDGKTHIEMSAATRNGYCFVSKTFGFRLSASSSYAPYEEEVWRFTEADGKAKIERTRFELVQKGSSWVKSRTTIDLAHVTRSNGVSVWGFREGNDVILLAQGADGGRESPHPAADDSGDSGVSMMSFTSSDCTWGATRLNMAFAKTGSIAQLRGGLPPVDDAGGAAGKKVVPRFLINGSLSKVSRDPEPILAVNVLLTDS